MASAGDDASGPERSALDRGVLGGLVVFEGRTHEIAVEPFLYIGLIAVVRRILIVTAQFERLPSGGRDLTNLLLELGLLGFLALALAIAVRLVRQRPA
jgi:hypothetical protein